MIALEGGDDDDEEEPVYLINCALSFFHILFIHNDFLFFPFYINPEGANINYPFKNNKKDELN